MKTRDFQLCISALILFVLAATTNPAHCQTNLPVDSTHQNIPVVKSSEGVDTTIFTKVEVEASFPGGLDGWRTFLENNLKADIPVRRKAPAGQYTVVVQFIVDKKGDLSDIRPLTALGYGMEQEVVRVLRKSPKWVPAQMKGGPVKAYRRQPITFVVSEGK